jgi:hypothetical protein
MKLILERSQRSGGILGNRQVFVLTVRAEISQAERDAINKYRLADTVLYQSHEIVDKGSGLLGLASRLYLGSMIKKLIVRELVEGKTFECADIVEMKGIEGQIMEAAQTFKTILDTAATFGGREVIEL